MLDQHMLPAINTIVIQLDLWRFILIWRGPNEMSSKLIESYDVMLEEHQNNNKQ